MRRRRGSKLWIVILILLVLALAAVVLTRYVYVVRDVQISGTRDVSDEALIRAAHIDFGESIFRTDAEFIRRGVNSLGTVRLDSVERVYPDTLILNVSQRQPRAMLLHLGDIRILDEECCVIESVDTVPDTDLIYVRGMSVTQYTPGVPLQSGMGETEAYCAIMQALEINDARAYVSEIDLSDVRSLTLITRTGITVELGDDSNMRNKIAWMCSAVADLESRNEGGGTLDVSSGTKADYSRPGGLAAPAPESPSD